MTELVYVSPLKVARDRAGFTWRYKDRRAVSLYILKILDRYVKITENPLHAAVSSVPAKRILIYLLKKNLSRFQIKGSPLYQILVRDFMYNWKYTLKERERQKIAMAVTPFSHVSLELLHLVFF